MGTQRVAIRTLAGLTVWGGFGLTATAQIPAMTLEKAFEVKPHQPGVTIPTPSATELARYRLEGIPNPKQPGSNMGFVVRDSQNQNRPVRQFVSYDNKTFNIVAFYIDGQEAYREVFPPQAGEPHQFRWLGSNGGKWGLDKDRDGTVDEWVVISPEEASQELFQALITRDVKRLRALLPSKENLDTLGLPPAETARIRDKAAAAAKRLLEAAEAMKLSPEAKWIHLELGIPHTTPADAFGGRDDLMVHKNGTVLIQDRDKTLFLQTGEMMLIGRAWKLIDGPSAGPGGVAVQGDTPTPGVPPVTPEIAELVKRLDEIDKKAPPTATAEALAAYNLQRAEILEQIVQKLTPDKQEMWVQLLIDSLAAAAEAGPVDSKPHARLKVLKDALTKGGAHTPLAAYVSFRLLRSENRIALAGAKDIAPIQDKWRAELEAFIKAYPTSEDAPEATLQLAMAYEFSKDGEPKAKSWYEHLAKTYRDHPHAAKAAGAIKRLESEGKPLDIQGPLLGSGQPFTAGQLNGKVVVVYYWASWSSSLGEDAKKLKELLTTYGPKGFVLVTVCLDDDPKSAAQAVAGLQLPGTHLHQPGIIGGLDRNPLAAAYGIHVVPHLFLAGKDGKVISRNAQINTLEDDLKKMLP